MGSFLFLLRERGVEVLPRPQLYQSRAAADGTAFLTDGGEQGMEGKRKKK